MHELTVFCMDVDVTVEVYPAALHVASNAITRLQECYTCDRIGWHFDPVWVEDSVRAVSKVEKVPRHKPSSPLGGSACISQPPRSR